MTDLEISRALALAIGWLPHQMQFEGCASSLLICVEVATLKSDAYWRWFDYRHPAVIWPIAEQYNCFPYKVRDRSGAITGEWNAWDAKHKDYPAETAAKAVALAVIGAKK